MATSYLPAVKHQLLKVLSLNAPGIAAGRPAPIPFATSDEFSQPEFPAYDLGYQPGALVVVQLIAPFPPAGQCSQHTYHMVNEQALHPLLFQLEPIPDPNQKVMVPHLVDVAGHPQLGNRGAQLRFFSFLPRWINRDVPGFLLELWFRLDARLEPTDIIDRMVPDGKKHPAPNVLYMRRIRFRESIQVFAYATGRAWTQELDVALLGTLTREQILLNTRMVVDLARNRLLKPIMHRKTTVTFVDSGLPLDLFLRGFPSLDSIPSDRQILAVKLRERLQLLALAKGLGNGPENYQGLLRVDRPSWWASRKAERHDGRKITELDNKSHEEFFNDLLANHPGIKKSTASRTSRPKPIPTSASAKKPMAQDTAPETGEAEEQNNDVTTPNEADDVDKVAAAAADGDDGDDNTATHATPIPRAQNGPEVPNPDYQPLTLPAEAGMRGSSSASNLH